MTADAVPAELAGFRTMFSAFHHCPPALARRVLADARRRGAGIAILEATRRDPRALAFMLVVPLLVLVATPVLRPFRWSRLLLTYVLPVIPLVALVDGVVSCLRTYTPDELRALAAADDDDPGGAPGGVPYVWAAGEAGAGPIPMTYLIGRPARDRGGREAGEVRPLECLAANGAPLGTAASSDGRAACVIPTPHIAANCRSTALGSARRSAYTCRAIGSG